MDAASRGGVDNRLDHAETASAVRARKDVHVERAPEGAATIAAEASSRKAVRPEVETSAGHSECSG